MKKLIAIVTGGLEFNGNSVNEKALGGSESAVIYMAQELARLGNLVMVYCHCDRPGNYDGVLYQNVSEFNNITSKTFDVLIISRNLEVLRPELISNLTIFWMHDIYHPIFAGYTHLVDKVFLLSEYQKSLWVQASKHYEPMIEITSNGFDKQLALATPINSFDQRKNNYIYASRPERGLKFLLMSIWPEIIKNNPQAQLIVCGYDNPTEMPKDTQQYYDDCDTLIKSSTNVTPIGKLSKPMFYQALGQCAYMLYPCDYPETSCINAIEAMAMGCLVISSDAFALKETVKTDTLVTADTEDDYRDKFVAKVLEYQDEDLYKDATKVASDAVYLQYPWDNVAISWNEKFDQMFEERYEKYKPQIFRRLGYYSDFVTWSKVDPDFDHTIFESSAKVNFEFDYFVSDIGVPEIPDDKNHIVGNKRQQAMKDFIAGYFRKFPDKKFTVLELGCYDGAILGNLYRENPESIEKVIGYDCRQDPLDAFKIIWGRNPQCTNMEFILDDIANLSKHKNLKADVIIVGEILEHIIDYKSVLEAIHKCATPGALILFSTPIGPWEDISKKEFNRTYHDDQHVQHYELLDLFTIFKEHRIENQFFIWRLPAVINYRNEHCGNYIFGYYNNVDKPFHHYDHILKAKKLRPYFSISTCMIIRNEENNLYRCLKSIKSISDEIIIVDTGSKDHSKQICSEFTNKIYDLKWEEEDGIGSFERARNFSIDKATGDYIFYIDADEELINPQFLADFIRSEYVLTFGIQQKQLMEEGGTFHDQYPNRLFRKGYLRFIGVIHELPRQDPNRDNDFLQILIPKMTRLLHYGYMDNRIRFPKLKRNYDLLMKNIEKYPDMIDNWMYHIRDTLYAYQFYMDKQMLYTMINLWRNYPDKHTSFREIQFWFDSFGFMQPALTILELEDGFPVIKKRINGQDLRFITKKEIKIFKELSIINKKEGGLFTDHT